jgi:hypothetical protein
MKDIIDKLKGCDTLLKGSIYSKYVQEYINEIDTDGLYDLITPETIEDTTEVKNVEEREDKPYGLVFKFE